MKRSSFLTTMILAASAASMAFGEPAAADDLQLAGRTFDLGRPHSKEVQYFSMESRMNTHAPDGRVMDTQVFRLRLKYTPLGASEGDRCTCLGFTIQHNEEAQVAIPSLANWSYLFKHTGNERDEQGQTLGIDHKPFENLVDANGAKVSPAIAYHVYNAFIDFHTFQLFAERTSSGKGIQDLTKIGQKIVHAASHSKPATDLGGAAAKGSYFENGEVTLELKGIGLVDGRECAVLGYDSGASSFVMLMKPVPEMEIKTTGSSHYWGDIYKDLSSQWIRKADLTELVLSETQLPSPQKPLDAVIQRSIVVRNLPPAVALTPMIP